MRITKICEYCREAFEAKTTVTRYCSHTCNRRAYKKRKREEKLEQAAKQTQVQKTVRLPSPDTDLGVLHQKAFLNVDEAALLIGISRRTLYRLLGNGTLSKRKLGTRTIIRRADIDELMM
jgi:excisionase family DNA binding protein